MPASVPDCAGLHTRGTTIRARIVLDGDLGCLAELLDDQETAMSLDHARDVQVASVPAILARSGFSPAVVGQSLSVARSANRRAENEARPPSGTPTKAS